MDEQTILIKALLKAKENGFSKVIADNYISLLNSGAAPATIARSFIFSHDFARALWHADDPLWNVTYSDTLQLDGHTITVPAWEYHLKKMVVAEDPIVYLGGAL